MSKMVYCSKCGSANKITNNKCEKCGEFLLKPEFFEEKKQEKFREIFTAKNKKAISQITIDSYNTVIKNIINIGHDHLNQLIKENHKNKDELSILDKIKILAQSYAEINYKTSGAALGHYAYNSITIDDRLYDSRQISTLIHELAHHLFSEIIEELLMYVWQCNKSESIEAFSWFAITGSPLIALTNEYCAHTCEGRFIPHGYQNYGSFNNILNKEFDPEKDKEQISLAFLFGNTMAHDIIYILEEFIGPDLRDEIKQQFKEDSFPPNYDQIIQEIEDLMPDDVKIKVLTDIINAGYDAAQNRSMYQSLQDFRDLFREANKSYHFH